MPTAAKLADLKLSREVVWYLLDRGYGLPEPWQAPLYRTPEPVDVPGAVFDGEAVDRVLRVMSLLKHTKGDFAGRPLIPDVWQIAYIFAPVFGWKAPNDAGRLVRIVREAWIELSRKNGKSTTVGGVGIYMTTADGEQGAECVAAATNERQAGFVFQPVRALVQGSPLLAQYAKAYQKKIIHQPTMSDFSVVSSAADGLHGANLHFYCVDEVHVHKSADLIEAIETGTGSRSQPLGMLITTADDGRPDTIYVRKRNRVVALAEGIFSDPSTYGVIWAAAKSEKHLKEIGLDPFSVEAQRRANPGYGVSPTAEYLARQALIARQSPADYSKYLRLHLGVRTKQAITYITVEKWDLNAGPGFDPRLMVGKRCFGGLDLASTSDFTALCWLFPMEDGRFRAVWRFWLPESGYERLVKRTSKEIEGWRRAGLVKVTGGDVVDDEQIENDILGDCATYKVAELGYDPWNASAITNTLSKHGVPLMEVRQGYASLSPALKEIKRRLYLASPEQAQIEHGGNPIMRWMLANLAVAMDTNENVKPDRLRSADKIDGVAALTTAMQRALAAKPERRSAYADRGLTVAR